MRQENASAALLLLKSNSLLIENAPVAEAMIQLCEEGDLLIKIAPGIQNLVKPDP